MLPGEGEFVVVMPFLVGVMTMGVKLGRKECPVNRGPPVELWVGPDLAWLAILNSLVLA